MGKGKDPTLTNAVENSVDDVYGRSVRPRYFSNVEKHKCPKSLQRLDEATIELLRSYLNTADLGLEITRTNHTSIILLWLISDAGDLWFCIEEMYKADSENTVFPRLDGVEYPLGYEKLGHPSMVGAGEARIAGELLWDAFARSNGCWVLSNKSGRYGIREDITPQHLENAAKKFRDLGISLDSHYIRYDP